MKDETFAELLESMNQALEHSKGKRDLRTTAVPLPPAPLNGRAVKRVRAKLRFSQSVFARYLNVSTKLVQAWEADRRQPEGPALVLLHIVAEQPGVIEAIRHATRTVQPVTANAGRRLAAGHRHKTSGRMRSRRSVTART